MTELEGLLHRALCEIRNPAETAAEVINFCDGLLRRRKRLKRPVCQEALARLQWLNLNDANLKEAESVIFERRLSKALAEVQEETERSRRRPMSRADGGPRAGRGAGRGRGGGGPGGDGGP